MNKTKLKRFLDYAIERINEYDEVDGSERFNALKLSPCEGCEIAIEIGDDWIIKCLVCPFNITEDRDFNACRPFKERTMKQHQDMLIKATKRWCKKYLPEHSIERVK